MMMKYTRLAVLLAAVAPTLALAAPQYTITDLGVVDGLTYGQAFGISSNGRYVIGRNLNDNATNVTPWPAFVWSAEDGVFEQGNLAGRDYAWGYAINNAGVGVGVSAVGGTGADPLPVKWVNGKATALALPSGQVVGRAFDINNSGIAVGSVGSGTGEVAVIYNTNTNTSSLITAKTSGGAIMQTAQAISDNGLVVGAGLLNSLNVTVVYNSNTRTMTQLAMPAYSGANSSMAFDISDNGQFIVGTSGNSSQSWIWSAGTGTLLAELPSISSNGSLRSVNDQGWAVGNSGGVFSNPILYADGTTYLIKDLITNPEGWNFSTTTSASAEGISSNGTIVGTAKINGVEHAYMMTLVTAAVPEPATYGLMGLGLLAVGATARRRKAEA